MTDETMRSPDQEPNLALLFLRMAESLVTRWKFLVFGGMIFLGLSAGVIVMLPRAYVAKGTVLFTAAKTSPGGGALSLLKEAGLGGILGEDGANLDQACALMESDKLALWATQRYRLDTVGRDEAAKDSLKPEVLIKNWHAAFVYHITDFNAMEVTYQAKSPVLAAQVVEGACHWLDSITLDIHQQQSRQNLAFIEEQLAIQTAAFDSAQARLLEFQKKNRILALPEQLQASVEGSAKLESEALMADIRAKSALATSGQESSEYRKMIEYRDDLRREARKILGDPGSAGAFQGFDKGLGKLAEVGRLQREIVGRKTIYAFLAQQREQLLLESRKSVPSIYFLDKPFVPRKPRTPPRYALFMLAAAFWGIGMSSFLIGRDALRRRNWTSGERSSLAAITESIPLGRLLRKLL